MIHGYKYSPETNHIFFNCVLHMNRPLQCTIEILICKPSLAILTYKGICAESTQNFQNNWQNVFNKPNADYYAT